MAEGLRAGPDAPRFDEFVAEITRRIDAARTAVEVKQTVASPV